VAEDDIHREILQGFMGEEDSTEHMGEIQDAEEDEEELESSEADSEENVNDALDTFVFGAIDILLSEDTTRFLGIEKLHRARRWWPNIRVDSLTGKVVRG
jgi:hypothetical protein